MRQSQKTEQQADRLSRIGLENRKYTRARSTDYGEGKGMSVTIQDLVLDRNNLNQAYLRVKRNKGAAGIDDMTVNDLLPYLKENKTELIASLREGKYKPAPVKRVEIPGIHFLVWIEIPCQIFLYKKEDICCPLVIQSIHHKNHERRLNKCPIMILS